jgi:hypothetical protein
VFFSPCGRQPEIGSVRAFAQFADGVVDDGVGGLLV